MEDQKAWDIWMENEWRSGRDPYKSGDCPLIGNQTVKNQQDKVQQMVYMQSEINANLLSVLGAVNRHFLREQGVNKPDCYFYHIEHQMGAQIAICTYRNQGLGHCPCNTCDKYISRREVSKLAREKVNCVDEDI